MLDMKPAPCAVLAFTIPHSFPVHLKPKTNAKGGTALTVETVVLVVCVTFAAVLVVVMVVAEMFVAPVVFVTLPVVVEDVG